MQRSHSCAVLIHAKHTGNVYAAHASGAAMQAPITMFLHCQTNNALLVASAGASIISPCACSKVAQMHIGNAPCFLMEPVVSHVMTGSWSKGGACVTWLQSSRSKMRNGNSRHVTTLLCCAVLCCAVLCCAVLCCAHASQKYELANMSVWRARL